MTNPFCLLTWSYQVGKACICEAVSRSSEFMGVWPRKMVWPVDGFQTWLLASGRTVGGESWLEKEALGMCLWRMCLPLPLPSQPFEASSLNLPCWFPACPQLRNTSLMTMDSNFGNCQKIFELIFLLFCFDLVFFVCLFVFHMNGTNPGGVPEWGKPNYF